ncbi:MAG: HAD family hydrolase [Prevotellaceae bacterium]|jgi:phosphoglycolate phosphatase|nr:HAD family hydrolase [Prevotellaceae bacterium]
MTGITVTECDKNMKKTYKAVIFDLDGTLINSIPDIADSMNRILEKFGYPEYTYEQYRLFLGRGIRRLVEICIPPEQANESNIDLIYNLMVEEYSDNCTEKTVVYDGIDNLLNRLSAKGVKLAVLSNKADSITQKICRILFRSHRFEQILGATEQFPRKPDPGSALYLAEQIAVRPEDIFYLGDTGIDMETAQAAGFFPAGAAWGFRGSAELANANACFIASKPDDCMQFFP